MMFLVKPSGTDAKDIAIHFLKMKDYPLSKTNIAKNIVQAKTLLCKGYTKDEIIAVLDKAIGNNPNIYSLAYIQYCIDEMAKEIKSKAVKQEIQAEAKTEFAKRQQEVNPDSESCNRNRNKLERFGVKSRLREKFDFDMFKK
jgi:hypothetical protein